MRERAAQCFPGIFDGAMPADEFQSAGYEWEPEAQVITNVKDGFHFPQVEQCLRQHAEGIVAYAIVPVLDGHTLSIELQFGSEAQSRAFQKSYRKVRLHKPKTTNVHSATKLHNGRMYILPDGREFLMYAKWDNSRRIGKVVAQRSDGTLALANEIVDEDVLRQCRVVPKGQERWGLGD